MSGSQYPLSKDQQNVTKPGLVEPRHFSQNWQRGSSLVDIQGDAAANGTLILSIPVPANRTLQIFGLFLGTKVGAKKFLVVESNLATVGGVETVHLDIDIPGAGTAVGIANLSPLAVIINATAVQRFCNIYMPQARAGAATNNAAGQYCSASVMGVLD